MSEQTINSTAGPEEKLPFDPKTLLVSLSRRWPYLLAVIVVSCILGFVLGNTFGTRSYSAGTLVKYNDQNDFVGDTDGPSMTTFIRLVTIPTNLAEVRDRLKLNASIEQLGRACGAYLQKGTKLMTIAATWDNPEMAANIANTLREVFFNSQRKIKKADMGQEMRELQDRLEKATAEYDKADKDLQAFKKANNIIDLGAETKNYVNQLSLLDRLYEAAQLQRESFRMGNATFDQLGTLNLSSNLPRTTDMNDLAALDMRIQMITSNMQSEEAYRLKEAQLLQKERDVKMAEKQKTLGLISEMEYQKVLTAYENLKAQQVDTEKLKEYQAQLQKALDDRVRQINRSRNKLQAKLETLPEVSAEYASLERYLQFHTNQKHKLEASLLEAQRRYSSSMSDFSSLGEATPPIAPSEENHKTIMVAVAFMGSLLGFVVIFAIELLNIKIKSGAEIPLKLSLPLLGALPKLGRGETIFPGRGETELIEDFRIMARRIRQFVPKRGARILLVSATHGEGTSQVLANLGLCYGRQDERVLLVDAQVRSASHDHELSELLLESEEEIKGLGGVPVL